MRISYSALQTFGQCPKRYEFKEILKQKEVKLKAQIFGTLLHSALRFMFSHDPLFPTLDQVINFFLSAFPADWDAVEARIYKERGQTILKKFYEKNLPWNFVVVALESRFEVVLEDAARNRAHVLTGIIDRIDKLDDDSYEIIDYKTKRSLPAQLDVDRDLQLSVYAMGLLKRWPHLTPEKIKVSLIFLNHWEKLSSERSAGDLAATETEILGSVREIETRIENKTEFEPRVSPLCDFCGFKPQCPAWRHLYRNVTKETIDGAAVGGVMDEYFTLRDKKKEAELRLRHLAVLLSRYLEEESIDRVFHERGIIGRRTIEKYAYDLDKVRAVLEPLGKWEQILKADEVKLKALIKEIPSWARAELKNARMLVKKTSILTATKTKIPLPAGEPGAPAESRTPRQADRV